ncbi:hypothetical protein SISNIDRAFT_488635 [Sistotremastrum niveocremeum HHB9708]|uniref:JmjC domain-containing protein n=1 Tax=Sistotremastrum niveocremeum HHB9708 TaxID=1314777 RepID=A0A164QZ77_9AGAM|nr:hypothetical protein SISNIDRAFT_488635 [Sistotremastrum niveocremeum HHB9708]
MPPRKDKKKTVPSPPLAAVLSDSPPADVLTLAREISLPNSSPPSKMVRYVPKDAIDATYIEKIESQYEARLAAVSQTVLEKFPSFKFGDVAQTITDPIKYLCLQRVLFHVRELKHGMEEREPKWDGSDMVRCVDSRVLEGWVIPVGKSREEIASRAAIHPSEEQEKWHDFLMGSGIRMAADTMVPTRASEQVTNRAITHRILETAAGAGKEGEAISNVCNAALGLQWLMLRTEDERIEFMRNVHAWVGELKKLNSQRAEVLEEWYNCGSYSARNANNPVRLMHCAHLALAYGPSILLKGEKLMSARVSLKSIVGDLLVPQRQPSPMQAGVHRRMWRSMFSLLAKDGDFYIPWNTVRFFAAELPSQIDGLAAAQSANITYVLGVPQLESPGAAPDAQNVSSPQPQRTQARRIRQKDGVQEEEVPHQSPSRLSGTGADIDIELREPTIEELLLETVDSASPPQQSRASSRASSPLTPAPSPPPSASEGGQDILSAERDADMADAQSLTPAGSSETLGSKPRRTPLPAFFPDEQSEGSANASAEAAPDIARVDSGAVLAESNSQVPVATIPKDDEDPDTTSAQRTARSTRKRNLEDATESVSKRPFKSTPDAQPLKVVAEEMKRPKKLKLRPLIARKPTLAVDGLEHSGRPARLPLVETVEEEIPYVRIGNQGEVMRTGNTVYSPLTFDKCNHTIRKKVKSSETDDRWRKAILSRTLDKLYADTSKRYTPASRSFLTLTAAEWSQMKRSNIHEARAVMRDRCLVIVGSASYEGCEGLVLDGLPPKPVDEVAEMHLSFEQWTARKEALKKRQEEISQRLRKPGAADLRALFKCLNLDTTTHRSAQDQSLRESKPKHTVEGEKMICYEALEQLLDERKFLNFLSLMGHHRSDPAEIREFIDTTMAAHALFTFRSSDLGHPSWVIAGNNGVISQDHVDASGAATWIECLAGIKAWCVKTGAAFTREDDLNADDPDLDGWETIILYPGDKLFMPPGTGHAVLSVETSVCDGGYVFPNTSYDLTLDALIEEHWAGLVLTNTSEPALTANFFRLWMYYAKHWKNGVAKDEDWPKHVPPVEQLVALYLIVTKMQHLTPQMAVDPEDPPLLPTHYKLDRD